jgi:acetoin utilization protein AcuC
MQNKPNFSRAKMNVTASITKEYENLQPFSRCENKANQTQRWLCNSPTFAIKRQAEYKFFLNVLKTLWFNVEMRKAAFIYSLEFEKYPYPPAMPFNTSRAAGVKKIIQSMGLLAHPEQGQKAGEKTFQAEPQPADRITLKKFHTAAYLHALKSANDGKFEPSALFMGIGSPDCPVFKGMYEYSALACGATLLGAQLILDGKASAAFNPTGGLHHSGPEKAAGFCYMNDNALGCMVLAEQGKRVLYLDVDVHHGDGVQNAFYSRNDVMTISFHQNGRTLFPGTGFEDEIGSGEGLGFAVNVPLPIGTFDEAYMFAYRQVAEPLIAAFNPDIIVFELGADALAGDPLANLNLTNNTYAEIIKSLLGFNKPILMTGGGGYNVENTIRAWALAWSVLCGEDGDNENVGMGGVFLQSTDWQGGLRDRQLPISKAQHDAVMPIVNETVEKVKRLVFPIHNL